MLNYRSLSKIIPPIFRKPILFLVLMVIAFRKLSFHSFIQYWFLKIKLLNTDLKFARNKEKINNISLTSGLSLSIRSIRSDLGIFEQIFFFNDVHLRKNLDGMNIMDGGAHIGCSTLFFKQLWPNSRILAIEPAVGNYEMLVKNTQGVENIESYNGAVWESSKDLVISNPDDEDWTFRLKSTELADAKVCVKGMSILEYMDMYGFERVGLLKLDIEGAEKTLFLQGNNAWLDRVDNLIVELHENIVEGTVSAFWAMMEDYTFDRVDTNFNTVCLNIVSKVS